MLKENIVLSAKNISKKYEGEKPGFFTNRNTGTEFYALKNISFDLESGRILGIIGTNGAGKSTLLKILAGIIPPTEGHVSYSGNILSILEIGTGFHPDLSGNENIYINAGILGLSKKEIDEVKQSIIDFSGLGNKIHEAVSTYSSGMYLRLAFSIALHVKCDILLLDEVIAVGDIEFKEKSLLKLKEKIRDGTSCILASHNLDSISELCNNCLWIENGEIFKHGKSFDVVNEYYKSKSLKTNIGNINLNNQTELIFHKITCNKQIYSTEENIIVEVDFTAQKPGSYTVFFWVRNYSTKVMIACNGFNDNDQSPFRNVSTGIHKAICTIPSNLFNKGFYFLDLTLGTPTTQLTMFENATNFEIRINESEAKKLYSSSSEQIPFKPACIWQLEKVEQHG